MKRNSFGLKLAVSLAALATAPAVAQALPITIPPVTDPRFTGLNIPANAPSLGMWSASFAWPLVALHLAVLPDGQVLSYGTPLGQGVQDGRTFDRWNPLTANVAQGHTTIPNSATVDSFCAAGVLQTGGAMLVSGGDSNASPGNLSKNSTVFNYTVNTASTQSSVMAQNRWYASMIKLADGRTMITGGGLPYVTEAYANPGGNLNNVSMTPEVWTPGLGWSSLTGISVSNGGRDAFGPDFNRWWYPRNWVAPNGNVFGISAEKMWYLNPTGTGSITFVANFKTGYNNTTRPNVGPTSTAVMYDIGRILQVGGNGPTNGYQSPSSEFATTFDINGGNPVVAETAAMVNRRQWANATVVPNGRVIVTGGTRFADNGGGDAVFTAEWWNPATGTWSSLSNAAIIRNYHSATLLMPNGTILSTGGGVPGPVTNFNGEIFYPPYLFVTGGGGQAQLADRPRMIGITANRAAYGSSFQVEMADTRTISKVAIIGLGSTTHSFDMGQRYIPASFSQAGAMLTITAPANANIAPPGYYQVVAVDSPGVPSRGYVITLGNALPAPNLIAHYPFDQTSGTLAPDASGNGKNGTLVGGATWVAGRVGSNAVRLSGSNQYVDLPDALVQGCTDFTFAGWVNLAAAQNWARIFDFGNGTATNMFMTARAGGATLRFAIKNNGGAEQQISYGTTFPTNQWRHVAVVLSGNTGRLYLSGIQVAQNTNLVLNPINLGATPNVWLGRSQYTADPYLNGTLDDVRMSCRAYSAEEIAALAAM